MSKSGFIGATNTDWERAATTDSSRFRSIARLQASTTPDSILDSLYS